MGPHGHRPTTDCHHYFKPSGKGPWEWVTGRGDRQPQGSRTGSGDRVRLKWFPVQENLLRVGSLPAPTALPGSGRASPKEERGRHLCPLEEPRCCGPGPTHWPHPPGEPAAARSEAEDCGKISGHRCLSDSLCTGGSCLCWVSRSPHTAQNHPGYATVPTSQRAAGARIIPGNRLKLSFPAEWPRASRPCFISCRASMNILHT